MGKCWICQFVRSLSYTIVTIWQELVPRDFLPVEFLCAIKHSDYSSVRYFLLKMEFLFQEYWLYVVFQHFLMLCNVPFRRE
jgi:hypothetical protein